MMNAQLNKPRTRWPGRTLASKTAALTRKLLFPTTFADPDFSANKTQEAITSMRLNSPGLSKAEIIGPASQTRVLPQLDVKAVLEHRAALVKADQDATMWDRAARDLVRDNPTIMKAVQFMDEIKYADSKLGWPSQPGEAPVPKGDHQMGSGLASSREHALKSMLYKQLEPMGKGGELHIHMNTLGDPLKYMKLATKLVPKTYYVRFSKPLTTRENIEGTEVGFEIYKRGTKDGNPFSPEYTSVASANDLKVKAFSNGMLWTTFLQTFPAVYKNIMGADDKRYIDPETKTFDPMLWAVDRVIVTDEDVLSAECQCNPLWAKFNMGTRGWKNLINYEGAWKHYCAEMFELLLAQGRNYAELRTIFMEAGIPNNDGTAILTPTTQINLYQDAFHKFQDQGNNAIRFPVMPPMIICAPRSIPKNVMKMKLDQTFLLRQECGEVIAGFDLVGAEDRGDPTSTFTKELVDFHNRNLEWDYYIPFMFHCGESHSDMLGTNDPANSGCYDIISLNSHRIGHGTSFLSHPPLMEYLRSRNAAGAKHAFEICLTSNEFLGLYSSANAHPFKLLLANGLPVVFCTDNANLFKTSGHLELYLAYASMANMSLIGLFQTIIWSYQYSLATDEQVKLLVDAELVKFEDFCAKMLDQANVDKVLEHYKELAETQKSGLTNEKLFPSLFVE